MITYYSELYKNRFTVLKFIKNSVDKNYASCYMAAAKNEDKDLTEKAVNYMNGFDQQQRNYYNYLMSVYDLVKTQEEAYKEGGVADIEKITKLTESICSYDKINLKDMGREKDGNGLSFITLLVKKDAVRMDCFETKVGRKAETVEEMYTAPVPFNKNRDFDSFFNGVVKMQEIFKKTDSLLHVNSSEYKKMFKNLTELKQMMVDFKEGKESQYDADYLTENIGNKMEELETSVLKYIEAKGIDGKATDLGNNRMTAALSLFNGIAEHKAVFKSSDYKYRLREFDDVTNIDFIEDEMEDDIEF